MQGKKLTNFGIAGDIDLLTSSTSSIKDLKMRLDGISKKMGMEISAEISKFLAVGSITERMADNIEVYGTPSEQTQQFKHLGSIIHGNGKSTTEVRT